jgi:hypothetical protein
MCKMGLFTAEKVSWNATGRLDAREPLGSLTGNNGRGTRFYEPSSVIATFALGSSGSGGVISTGTK